MFERVCGHVGAANPMALNLAGFGPETEIEGGELDQDETGCLTGVLREAALDRFKQFIPPPDQAMLTRALTAGIRTANQGGVTSVHSDDLVSVPMEDFLEAVKTLRDQGKFHIRIWEEVEAARLPFLEKLLDRGQRTGDGDCWYRMGNLKLLLDGSLGARTAYLRRPYEDDPENQGIRVYQQQDLDQLVLFAHRSGLQIAFHAIGDGAVEQAVTAVERAQRVCPKDLRHRVVHCQIADRRLFHRMASCGLGADIQPAFTSSDWPLVRSRLGEQREPGCYAWRSMLDAGLTIGGGSDSPVEPFEPLWGMLCAVTRNQCQGQPQEGWLPEEKLTIGQAVDLYTRGAASLEFAQGRKGMLRAGALADFVVLSEDFLQEGLEEQAAVQRLRAAKVLRTVVGGKTVYQRT